MNEIGTRGGDSEKPMKKDEENCYKELRAIGA